MLRTGLCLFAFIQTAHGQIYAVYPIEIRHTRTEYKNEFHYPKNHSLRVDGELLGRCFYLKANQLARVTLPTVDYSYPELFEYLKGSEEYTYESGKELFLRRLILNSPDNSVDPVQLFTWSLVLNQGDLFKSVLTVHQLLRNEARFYNPWVHYTSSKDQMHLFFNKLIDLRGDLEERGDSYLGDHRGTWYRMWGTMLHYLKMIAPETSELGSLTEVSRTAVRPAFALARGQLTSKLAEWQKPLTMKGRDHDPRKSELNLKGYDTMNSLITFAQNANLTQSEALALRHTCDRREYLVDQELEESALIARKP